MARDIVVFETEDGELDFRLIRQTLPSGSTPVALVDNGRWMAIEGEYNSLE